MDLKALKQFANAGKAQSGTQQKNQNLQEQINLGMRHLTDFLESGMQDKAAAKQASHTFLTVIKTDRRELQAYLGMGYLLLLLQEANKARIFLQEALRIEPDNADAGNLLRYSFELEKNKAATPLGISTFDSAEPEDDYDHLEDFITAKIRSAMHTPVLVAQAEADLDKALQLQEHSHRLKYTLSLIQTKINLLGRSTDVLALNSRLRPLETILQRLDKTLAFSINLLDLNRHLETQLVTVQAELEQTKQSPDKVFQINLEHLLDQCDAFADKLDALEAQKQDIRPLLNNYKRLVAAVESLQELLDELAD
ncbi:hypothetical protein COW64_09495 [bacterium (Candidatus Blackallbacteria) CG18_big_fil_WC_8_21_14_2_50_49_26]|nr:MAG: hypothetical protein COW64_09495 [bacterium (Candidatus Blackallbacteria) CG18_big_fil_WC_8_21_14_2_50_49_26]